jgi:23S rRNA pseudouridine1911/1915/1917 synthase
MAPKTHPLTPPSPTVAARVRAQTGVAWSRARSLCAEGRVIVDGVPCLEPAMRIAPDAQVVVDERARPIASGPLARSAIVHADRDVVVVDKPAGMLSVADEPGNRDTLVDHTRTLLRKMGGAGGVDAPLGVVHRLDRDTSGVMLFARTAAAKRDLAAQFRAHSIDRVYHAVVHGSLSERRIESDLILDRGDGLRGSHGHFRPRGERTIEAKRAITHVRPLRALAGATLVECRLETGRQHQIRIHLAELGHPLVGERVYIRDYTGTTIASARPLLHAQTLGFVHPRSRERVAFERAPPADFAAMIAALSVAE